MKLAIVGSREFYKGKRTKALLKKEENLMKELLRGGFWIIAGLGFRVGTRQRDIHTIVSGGARGIDKMAENHAIEQGLNLDVFEADWNGPDGKAAGFKRNTKIVEACEAALVIWNRESKGTLDTISKLEAARKPYVLMTSRKHSEVFPTDQTMITVWGEDEWLKLRKQYKIK